MIDDTVLARLTVVVPAFNEATVVGRVLEELVSALPGAEIILVDDHSRDGTGVVASAVVGVRVLRHGFNRGQGASLKSGMRLATRDYVAWFDSDGEHRVEDLLKMVSHIVMDDLVAVIGQRSNGSASQTRAVGKWVIRLIGQSLRIKAGSDLNCGLRVFRREAMTRYIDLIPDRFSSSLVTTLVLLERRYPIAFQPIVTNPRVGYSTVLIKDGFEAILQLIRAVLLFSPLRFFLPLGAAALGLGVLYSAVVALATGLGVPIAGLFLMFSGLLTIFFGLLADQISQLRLGLLNAAPREDASELELHMARPVSTLDKPVEMFGAPPPSWALKRPKPLWQSLWDFAGAPLRMALLPDLRSEALHLTSLRAERLAVVLPELQGRVLDIGAGDNMLVRLHREKRAGGPEGERAQASVGIDVVDWGGDCVIVPDCRTLPFDDESVDTVAFVACLNHIPERIEAVAEAHRVLKPGGRVVVTMISKLIGDVGHSIWWYSEDKHRTVAAGEVMGMNPGDIRRLLRRAGFDEISRRGFVYGLNNLFVALKRPSAADPA